MSRSVLPLQAGRGGERRVGRREDSQPGEQQPTLSTNRTEVYTQMCTFSYLCLLATQHSDKLSGSIRHLGRWIENCGGFCHLSARKHSCYGKCPVSLVTLLLGVGWRKEVQAMAGLILLWCGCEFRPVLYSQPIDDLHIHKLVHD